MNRDTGSVLLVLVGGAILRISAGTTYLRYVKSTLHVPLIVAGTLLVLLGLVSLWRDNPGSRGRGRRPAEPAAAVAESPDGDAFTVTPLAGEVPAGDGSAGGLPARYPLPEALAAGADGHGHHHGLGSRMAWLLLAPVFALFLVAPPALGSYAAERSTVTRVPAPAADYPPLPAGDPLVMRLDEYEARAVWDAGRTLAGRRFDLTGFVSSRPGGGYYLTRLVVTCCAADAVPVRILVTGDAAGSFAADTWIRVVGRYGGVDRSREKDVGPIATIRADSVRTIDPPAEPYET